MSHVRVTIGWSTVKVEVDVEKTVEVLSPHLQKLANSCLEKSQECFVNIDKHLLLLRSDLTTQVQRLVNTLGALSTIVGIVIVVCGVAYTVRLVMDEIRARKLHEKRMEYLDMVDGKV
ncbi:hypothetical protein J3A83DRAFT_4194511 [Scleroderma citrinum]